MFQGVRTVLHEKVEKPVMFLTRCLFSITGIPIRLSKIKNLIAEFK